MSLYWQLHWQGRPFGSSGKASDHGCWQAVGCSAFQRTRWIILGMDAALSVPTVPFRSVSPCCSPPSQPAQPCIFWSPVRHTQQLLFLTPFQVGTIPKSMGRIALKTASTSPALAPVVMSSQCGKIFTDLCKQSISVELRVWWEQRNFWMFCPPQDSWHTIIIPPILQMGKMKLRKLPKLLQELCDRGLNTIQISQPDSISNYLENMNNKTSREV